MTFFLLMALGVVIILLIMEPTREIIFKTIFTTSSVSLQGIMIGLLYLMKKVIWAHITIIKHLITPHEVIFPSLKQKPKKE